jgi:flagellar motor switch protein FliG
MSTLRQVSGEVVGEVASSLASILSGQDMSAEEEVDGFQRAADVMLKLPRAEIRRMLEELEADHPEQVQQLRERIFTFESLAYADDRGMQELLRQIDSAKVALALHEADDAVTERILTNLSERAGSMLKEEIEFLGTVKPEDKAAARKELIETALKLENEGQLEFEEQVED